MLGLLNWLQIGTGAVIGAMAGGALFYAIGHWQGDTAGYERAQNEARARAMELIEQRSKDNEEISDLDAAGLCFELGGDWLSDEGRCN